MTVAHRSGPAESFKEFPRKFRIFLILFLATIVFGVVSYMSLSGVSFGRGLVMTFETLAFIFHDFVGVGKAVEIFLAIFGVFLVWWVLWSLFDILFAENFMTNIAALSTERRLKRMKNHYIVAGGGRVGEELAKRLAGVKKPYVIIEKNAKNVERIRKEGLVVFQGDVTNKEVLLKASITDAKALVLALPEAEINILVTLVAKELAPNVEIHARADTTEFADVMLKAGVKRVVVPEIAAVEQLFKEL